MPGCPGVMLQRHATTDVRHGPLVVHDGPLKKRAEGGIARQVWDGVFLFRFLSFFDVF